MSLLKASILLDINSANKIISKDSMYEFFRGLNEVIFYTMGGIVLVFTSIISMQIGAAFTRLKSKKDLSNMGDDTYDTQKKLKKLWDEEVSILKGKNKELDEQVKYLTSKLEDYRMKISGMGLLNFSGDKKRADILYSLLMENEALEQMLQNQSQKMVNDNQDHLTEKLRDTRKRQRLISEVFNDEKFKGYIQDIMNEEKDVSPTHSREGQQELGNSSSSQQLDFKNKE
jgi:hypothetical protein